jgi:FkbM family methyltransferase
VLDRIKAWLPARNAEWARDLRRPLSGIATLPIVRAGVEQDLARLEFEDGLIFYGHPTPAAMRRFWYRQPATVRRQVPLECFGTAFDYVVRYQEGGLRLGGPRKEADYRVRQGDVVAEMGAYQGHYTLYLARAVGPHGRVIAIEPNPRNVAVLRRNVEANGFDWVTVVEKGVSDQAGSAVFKVASGDGQSGSLVLDGGRGEAFDVELDSLDRILAGAAVDHVDFMCIQLNGVEDLALEGLTTLAPTHLAIAARYPRNGIDVAARVAEILSRRGYRVRSEPGGYLYAARG